MSMAGGKENGFCPDIFCMLPEGTSALQAAWFRVFSTLFNFLFSDLLEDIRVEMALS